MKYLLLLLASLACSGCFHRVAFVDVDGYRGGHGHHGGPGHRDGHGHHRPPPSHCPPPRHH